MSGRFTAKPDKPIPARRQLEVTILRGIPKGEGGAGARGGVKLSFRQDGVIEDVPAKAGAEVKKGDLIARLDSSELELALGKQESQAKALEAQVARDERALDRLRKMHSVGRAHMSDVDNAQVALEASKASLEPRPRLCSGCLPRRHPKRYCKGDGGTD